MSNLLCAEAAPRTEFMCVCVAANHVEECARLLEELGVKAVAFDMDQTMVAAHSHARMSKARVQEDFVARVSPDFVKLAPLLAQRGIHLAVATHSDRREHTDAVRCARLHNGGWVSGLIVGTSARLHPRHTCWVRTSQK